jgi:hypothetical protein
MEPGPLAEIKQLYDFQTLLEMITGAQQPQPLTTSASKGQGAQINPLSPFFQGGYIPEPEMTWEDIYRIIGRK